MINQIPDHFDAVPVGWRKVLEQLHRALIQCDSDYSVADVKEKFGALRVYLSTPETNEIRNEIARAEWRSEHTCELCGDRNARQVCVKGWWRALCFNHEPGVESD